MLTSPVMGLTAGICLIIAIGHATYQYYHQEESPYPLDWLEVGLEGLIIGVILYLGYVFWSMAVVALLMEAV